MPQNHETESVRGQGIDPFNFSRGTYTQFQTWLGETKSVEGCPLNCRYCFFKLDRQTPRHPHINMTPKETVDELKNATTYREDIPVNFGSQTDVFSTKETINHYQEILKIYGESGYSNPVVFVTKKIVPDSFIQIVKNIPQRVIFFISYSGLSGTKLEPTVNEKHQQENFIRLKNNGLPAVHYWRPFLPQNSSEEKIYGILEHVSRYATCSVVNGLRLNTGIRDNIAPYWPEILDRDYDFLKSGEFWPKGLRNFLKTYTKTKYPNYPVFFGNTPCSISYVLEKPDVQGLHKGRMCGESNCPIQQQKMCGHAFKKPTWESIEEGVKKMGITWEKVQLENDKIIIDQDIDTGKLVYLKYLLRFPVVTRNTLYDSGHNWANVTDDQEVIEVPWSQSYEAS